jgi:hypothetical protein
MFSLQPPRHISTLPGTAAPALRQRNSWGSYQSDDTGRYRLIRIALSTTSDRSLQFFNLKDPNGMLSIPISPTKMFVAVNEVAVLDKLRRAAATAPRKLATHATIYVVSRARRFVWAQDTSQQ